MLYAEFLLKKLIFCHLLVPLWKSREERRYQRNAVLEQLCEAYLHDLPVHVPQDCAQEHTPKEYVFSMWLQGEEQAPQIVRTCWESIRRHSTNELVILDADNIRQWIDLPDGFLRKWRKGSIKACHLSDLCRVELMWRYGGYWMDATCYMCHPVPDFISQSPFFVYLCDDGNNTFIQNCFIHACAHHPIVGAWRESLHEYWSKHTRAFDYFLPHRLFRHVVLNDKEIADLFAQMPQVRHSSKYALRWGGYWERPFDEERFRQLTQESMFQKLEHKSRSARRPLEGTFADYVVHGKALMLSE